MKKMVKRCYCEYCITELNSRGEKLYKGDLVLTGEEAEEEQKACEWCGEYDDLYECLMRG